MSIDELKQEPMMEHLIATLKSGHSIGHYGRLVFVMVARHFLDRDELMSLLKKDPECDEDQANALISQVEARDYNPPKRERILELMQKQEFPVCPNPADASQCNVYRNLEFPQEVYDRINEFYRQGSSITQGGAGREG
jgi:hypothetical protein